MAEQDREQFEQLLEQALAVDPDEEPRLRLANLIAQRRARFLLEHVDDLIADDDDADRDEGMLPSSR